MRRTVLVKGAKIGNWLVLRTPPPRGREVEVQCLTCGNKTVRRQEQVSGRVGKSCIRCRAKTHAEDVRCKKCGAICRRWTGTPENTICESCKRADHVRWSLARRAMALGRVCFTCERTDAEAKFMSTVACLACHRAATRNGKCSCGRAILKTRACLCGKPAQRSMADVANHARESTGPVIRDRSGRFSGKSGGERRSTAHDVPSWAVTGEKL